MNRSLRRASMLAASALFVTTAVNSQTLKGSDTMLQLGQEWAQAYMKANSGKTITVTGGGSTTGFAALLNGGTDI